MFSKVKYEYNTYVNPKWKFWFEAIGSIILVNAVFSLLYFSPVYELSNNMKQILSIASILFSIGSLLVTFEEHKKKGIIKFRNQIKESYIEKLINSDVEIKKIFDATPDYNKDQLSEILFVNALLKEKGKGN